MGLAEIERLVGVERRMDPAEHDVATGGANRPADLVTTQGIAGVDPDADDIPGFHTREIERFERFVRELGCAVGFGGRRGQHIKPDRKSTRLNSSHGYISYAV